MMDFRNAFVIAYIIIGYGCGIILFLCSCDSFVISAGIALLAHVLTWSAYIHHELSHNSVFQHQIWNTRCGRLMDWLSGACYWTF